MLSQASAKRKWLSSLSLVSSGMLEFLLAMVACYQVALVRPSGLHFQLGRPLRRRRDHGGLEGENK